MLKEFDKRGLHLQKTLVADSSILFDELEYFVDNNVIENKQQDFLSEVKLLADSLRNTVLDSSEQRPSEKVDKKTRTFLQEVIQRELNLEKIKREKQQKIDLEKISSNYLGSRLDVVEQQLDSQISLSKLVENSQQEQIDNSEASKAQASADQTTNKHKIERKIVKTKLDVEYKNLNESKSSIAEKEQAVYSLNKSLNEVENKLAKYQQQVDENKQDAEQFVQKKGRLVESQTKIKKQQIKQSINNNNIAEVNKESLKSLKDMVADKSAISKVLQRQGDLKKYQSELKTQVQQNPASSSTNKNIPLPGIKITNPLSKVSQAVNETISEVTASIKNQLESTAKHTTDTVSDIRSLLHKAGNQIIPPINQTPTSSGLLNNLIGNSEQKQSTNPKPLITPNQTKIGVSAVKEEQSQSTIKNAVAQIESSKATTRLANKDKTQAKNLPESQITNSLNEKLDTALKATNKYKNTQSQPPLSFEDIQQDLPKKQSVQKQIDGQELKSTQQKNDNISGIPEELQTAVQWMAEEEVENKLVDLLSRQAKLRGIDLS